MIKLPLDEICRVVRGRRLGSSAPLSVCGVSTDTRTAGAGELFVALRGPQFDAHAFLERAAAAGCAAALVCRDARVPPDQAERFPGGLIAVDNTLLALGELGAWHRTQVAAAVVAVTGSNGKTTVKRMIHHVLSRRLKGTCSPKSFNNDIGVPLTLLGVTPGHDYVVCELGSNAPGEIAHLARMVRPDVAVITSIGETHLEKLQSVQKVAVEKASLLDYLEPDGLAVTWADSSDLEKLLRLYHRRVVRFGLSVTAELRLTAWRQEGPVQRFCLNDHVWGTLSLPGQHMACNALAAIAVAQRFGFSQEEAVAALADFAGADMRLAWERCGKVTLINDAYNANPSSLAAAGRALGNWGKGRKVLVAGDMRELGDDARAIHRRVGAELAAAGVDFLIGVGELGRYIAQGAAEAGAGAQGFDTVEQASQALGDLLHAGDVILIKGSRAAAMERLLDPIRSAFGGPA